MFDIANIVSKEIKVLYLFYNIDTTIKDID